MPRRLRFIPEGGALVEVTCRTIHGRHLLKPCRILNEAIVGALARGKRRYGVRICAAVFMTTHYHLLLEVDDALQLARFMAFINAKIAREAGRAWRWRERLWGRRYQAIVVSAEESAAQIERLRYLLSHGVKEDLVARCREWPGVHCAEALATGRELVGYWFDRTRECAARARRMEPATYAHAERETLRFDPLPCWRHEQRATIEGYIAEMRSAIEDHAASGRRQRGVKIKGTKAMRRVRPHDRPARSKRSPAPAFHAVSRRARRAFAEAYRWFVEAFRAAAACLRAGEPAHFPPGSFPPALPFVAP